MPKIHPEFMRRLEQACDNLGGQIPQHNYGRLGWFVEQFQKRYEMTLAGETVRKWFAGETKPRDLAMQRLAEILQVDSAWLSMGSNAALPVKQQQVRNAAASGVVNIVAGFVQTANNAVAFPLPEDKYARDALIDMNVIIKGASYALHIVLAKPEAKGHAFAVPVAALERCLVIGVIQAEGEFALTLIELDGEFVQKLGTRKNSHLEFVVDGNLKTRDHQWRQITSFAERF